MPNLTITVAHALPLDEALRRSQNLLREVSKQFGDKIGDMHETWEGHTGTFRFSAMGMPVTGTLVVSPSQVEFSGMLPFAAMFFKESIASLIRAQAEALLVSSEQLAVGDDE